MNMTDMPLVSIVIPVYNGSNYLREAIDSALNQTYQNIEVIVVNDGSTDGGVTEEVALSYQDQIRYYRKENGGVSSALNYGIQQMRGAYFAWLSHDDLHLPQKVEKQMNAISKHTGSKPVICVCNYYLIDKNGKICTYTEQNIGSYFQKSLTCFLGSETTLMIDGDATLISKQVFDTCGLFNETLFASQETDMWYRSSKVADFIFIPDYLVGYRVHAQQVTHRRSRAVGLEAGEYRGNLIRQTSLQEMLNYYENEIDAFRFGKSVSQYVRLYFYKASHEMIAKIRQLSLMDWKYMNNVLAGMFEPLDINRIKNILSNDVSQTHHKTKIILYNKDWADGGLADRLMLFVKRLERDFEIIIVYSGDDNYTFPSNIQSVCLKPYTTGNNPEHAICVALLVELLQADILWCNAANFMPDAIVMNYLKDTRVCKIASFHCMELKARDFDIIQNDKDDTAALSDASIITFEKSDTMLARFMYPYDAVLMPTISGDEASYKKWETLFNTIHLLGSDEKEFNKNFTHVKKLDETEEPANAIQRIQPYLVQYADYTLKKYRAYYEQSFYWKISKPLRYISDVLKRHISHKK